jgi:hypothetical protein
MAKESTATQAPFWIVQQHDTFETSQAAGVPSAESGPGERQKRVYGPYQSQGDADVALARMKARTWPEMKKGGE